MLTIVNSAPSVKGHKMVEVFCSICNKTSVKRETSLKQIKSCGCNANNRISNLGKRFISKDGDEAVVIDVLPKAMALVEFLGYEDKPAEIFRLSRLRNGQFSNIWRKSLFGVGFSGMRQHKNLKDVTKIRNIWTNILARCYNSACKEYVSYGAKGVIVDEKWHNFSSFYGWYLKRDLNPNIKYHVDKDLLAKYDVKVYSEETCCLLPGEINRRLIILPKTRNTCGKGFKVRSSDSKRTIIGFFETEEEADIAYKDEKERNIHELAERFRADIEDKVYRALLRWRYCK
jgi:hypothetical protein